MKKRSGSKEKSFCTAKKHSCCLLRVSHPVTSPAGLLMVCYHLSYCSCVNRSARRLGRARRAKGKTGGKKGGLCYLLLVQHLLRQVLHQLRLLVDLFILKKMRVKDKIIKETSVSSTTHSSTKLHPIPPSAVQTKYCTELRAGLIRHSEVSGFYLVLKSVLHYLITRG